ncbi:MAG: HNH endonuclease [Oscillospiraceae bacterium]
MAQKNGIRETGFYKSKAWKNTSRKTFNKHLGICQMCGKIIGDARYVADHITELNTNNYHDQTLAYGEYNLQLLCLPCHNKKTFTDTTTAEEDNGKLRDNDIERLRKKWQKK